MYRLSLPPAGLFAAALAAALNCPSPARADDFVDLNCSSATVPMRALLDLKAHLPQPLGKLLDAAHAVAHEYQVCAANNRSSFQLENMNYALVQQATQQLFAGRLEARYGEPARARSDLKAAIDELQIVIGYKDRSKDPGPDQNDSGAHVTLDLRSDNAPSTFDRPAKTLLKHAQDVLAALEAGVDPADAPTPGPVPTA